MIPDQHIPHSAISNPKSDPPQSAADHRETGFPQGSSKAAIRIPQSEIRNPKSLRVLIVEDREDDARLLVRALKRDGFDVTWDCVDCEEDMRSRLRLESWDVIVCDYSIPGFGALEALGVYRQLGLDLPFLVVSGAVGEDVAVECMRQGAHDYLMKNSLTRLCEAVRRELREADSRRGKRHAEEQLKAALDELRSLHERVSAENVYLREEIRQGHLHGDIVGSSEAMKAALVQAEQVAGTDSTVLIVGETGTGKELMARAIHSMSRRRRKPLVTVNCASIPATLVESELFGHEKGAFTGAIKRRIGRFETADTGTIFLDEIGELMPEMQAKLLRVLQEGKVERLGNSASIDVDVRVLAATNRDLESDIEKGRFRQDLYFRLNVFPIVIPPLRERNDDVEPLVRAFVSEFSAGMGKRIDAIPRADIDRLRAYHWPGNVRELRNLVERAMITATGPTLRIPIPTGRRQPPTIPGDGTLDDVQRRHIGRVLERTNWRIRGARGAAQILGLKPTTLEARMRKLGLKRQGGASNIT
jgi:DNA-binding NtrC family response regulator